MSDLKNQMEEIQATIDERQVIVDDLSIDKMILQTNGTNIKIKL